MDEPSKRKARVFISCPQKRSKRHEIKIADEIYEYFKHEGYEPYKAIDTQALTGIDRMIFQMLRESEYFVFVDLERESLGNTNGHRGSLFCNQELAIAAYLGTPAICMREKKVRENEGMLGFLQGNPHIITHYSEILPFIKHRVKQNKWLNYHRNELLLGDTRHTDEPVCGVGCKAHYFQIQVRNLNQYEPALGCHVVVHRILRMDPAITELNSKSLELTWSGTQTLPHITIPAGNSRELAAIQYYETCPDRPRFLVHTDSTEFLPNLSGAGDYRITYALYSHNFPAVLQTYEVHVSQLSDQWTFKR